mmetsp:Transcript_123344/g.360148  ORF Transcript_123344/g.360148 Transcript_123344/m.360148 type:complete len:136 (-) Transcript_123344:583-990(-)
MRKQMPYMVDGLIQAPSQAMEPVKQYMEAIGHRSPSHMTYHLRKWEEVSGMNLANQVHMKGINQRPMNIGHLEYHLMVVHVRMRAIRHIPRRFAKLGKLGGAKSCRHRHLLRDMCIFRPLRIRAQRSLSGTCRMQ